jgi:hypothetical protein
MARRDVGKTFLDEILAKIPEAERAALAEKLAKDDILDTLGDGVLRQQDYSKQTNEVAQARTALDKEREQLEAWRGNNLPVIEEYLERKEAFEAWKASGGRPGDPGAPPKPVELPPDVLKRLAKVEELEKTVQTLNTLAGDVPAFSATLVSLSRRHEKNLGEDLDHMALFEHAKKLNTNIQVAYNDLYKDRYATLEKTKRDEELKAAEQRGREAALREHRSQLPHVVDTQEPSTLSGLKREGEDPLEAAKKAAIESHYSGEWRKIAEAAGS